MTIQQLNRKNLKFVSNLLDLLDIEYTAFYGTLLGIHRDGDIIPHDDDIDLLIDSIHFDRIFSLVNNGIVLPNVTWRTGNDRTFLQYKNQDNSIVDFYFYKNTPDDYVIDRWNFSATPNNPEYHLHIPKSFLKTKSFDMRGFETKIPEDTETVCKFLYGDRFRETLIKRKDYNNGILHNKPNHIYYK